MRGEHTFHEIFCCFGNDSTNFCVLLCGVVKEGFLDGLQAHVTRCEDAFLVFAGLQAQQLKDRADEPLRLHDCTLQHQHHSSQHDTKDRYDAKVSYLKVADLGPLHPPIDRALKVFSVASYACPCRAGHQTTPEMSSVPETITRLEAINKAKEPFRLEWCHHHLWAAVLGEEFSNTPDRDWDATVKQLYQGVAVQTTLSVCLAERQQGYKALYDVCRINDEGLGRIQPGCNRGREKAAIIVSDSTLMFKAGARTFVVEMAGDFEALQKPGHVLQQYVHLRQKAIWGGNLHSIVEAVLEAITDIVNKAKDPSCLEIDITVVWMGNELCGRRGVFLDPGTPNWQIGPEGYAAEGLWPEIAGRVCGEIGRLAALKGRPCVGSVQILGDADPHDYGLPQEYREAIQKFFGYALVLGESTPTASGRPSQQSPSTTTTIFAKIQHTELPSQTA